MALGERTGDQGMSRTLTTLLCCAVGYVPAEASTQGNGSADVGRTTTVRVQAGFGRHGTGSEDHCSQASSWSVGIAGELRGPLVLSGTLDFYGTGGLACNTILPVTEYNGERVEVWGETTMRFSPRFALHLGPEFRLGTTGLRASIGAGILRTRTDFGFGGRPGRYREIRSTWKPWYGVSLSAGQMHGFLVQLEVGRHWVPKRYYSRGVLRREFELRRSFTRLALSFPIFQLGSAGE